MVSVVPYHQNQVRSGQSAHSEQAVVAHACHGHRYRFLCPGQGKKGGGSKGGRPALAGTREYEQSESVAGGGWFEVLWNLECLVGLSQREICAHFNDGKLDDPPKNKELWSYVIKFEFSRLKVAQIIRVCRAAFKSSSSPCIGP